MGKESQTTQFIPQGAISPFLILPRLTLVIVDVITTEFSNSLFTILFAK